MNGKEAVNALVRSIELKLSRQRASLAETELQLEAAKALDVQSKAQADLLEKSARK